MEVITDVQRKQVLDRFRSGEVLASAAMAAGLSYKAANQILRDAIPNVRPADDLDDFRVTVREVGTGGVIPTFSIMFTE